MKRFITKLLIFLIIPIILVAIAIFSNEIVDQGYSMSNNIDTIFIGDSHFCYDLNLTNEAGVKMFSAESQSYEFSYFVLKKVLEDNPDHGLKSFYLSYSYHNIFHQAKRSDEKAYGKYFHLFSKEQKIEYIRNNIQDKLVFLREVFRTKFLQKIYNTPDYIKSGVMTNNSKLDSLNICKRIAYQFMDGNKLKAVDNKELLYLNKIQQMAKTHQLNLSLLITPLHPLYKKQIPLVVKEKMDSVSNHFSSSKILDYSSIEFLNENNAFFTHDGDHLTQKGALHFTPLLKKELVFYSQSHLISE